MQNLGVLGPMGSGKGFAAKYLAKKYGYQIITMGNIVRALARKERVSPKRENLEKVQKKYRDKYGSDYIVRQAIKKAEKSSKPVIFDGLRTKIDVSTAKKELGMKIILVDAKPEIRFQRLKKRRRADFPRTVKEFKRIEALENKTFHLRETFKYADYTVDNSDGEERLYSQLSRIVDNLKNKK